MARRTITIEKFTLPTGATDAPVTVSFTLVDATTHKPVDGYREDDNEGVVGLLKVKLSGASTTVDLTPNEEIAGDTVWKTQVTYKGIVHRTAYIALATGGALTFPEYLTLDTSPGHWTPLWSDLISAKGDLIAGTGAGTVNNLAVGTDGQALIADSGESTGLKWDTIAGDATSLQGTNIDISVGSPSDGDIMVYRNAGADFVLEAKPASGSNPALNDVSDVEISATADNDVLAYDTATGDWINQSAAEAGLAAASHVHTGVYEPADATILKDADISSTVQAYDANLPTWPAAVSATEVGYLDGVTSAIQTQINNKISSVEGTAVLSTGEAGGTKFLREDGDGTCSWQEGSGGASQLSDLSDVGVTTPTNRNVLVADSDSWESRALVEADISDLGSYEPAGVSAADITDSTADGRALITSADANPFTDANLTTLGTATQPGDVLTRTNTDVFAPTGDYHPATKKYVDDEITGAGGYNDEAAQDAVGGILTDTAEINFTYDDATPQITASIVASSIDESKLDVSVNASLDLADSAVQSVAAADITDATADGIALITSADANPFTDANATTLGSAIQPGDLATVATTGAYSDVSGTPTIPTASDAVPQDLGTAAAGASADFSRADHVHNAPAGSAADIDQYDIAARLSAGTGAYAGVAVADLTEETTPATGDFLVGWESGGALRKFDIGDLPSGSGTVDTSGVPVANDIARFTDADTIEGRSYTELKSDLSLGSAADVATDLADLNEATIEAAIDTLANLTSVQGLTVTLADAGANALWGWDDVAGAYENLSAAEARTILNVEDGADVTDATNVDAAGAVMESDVDAKGDIFVATADNTLTRLPVGTNDQILTADSAEASGVKWAAAPSGTWDGDIADIDLDGGTDIGADLVDADLILVDDGAAGTNRKSALSRLWTYIASKLSIIGGTDDILLFGVACSDETTDLTTGQKVAFDIPFSCVLERVYVSATTAASGANLEVDVEDEGTSLLNAVFGFQTNNAETSTFASAAASYTLTKGDLLSIDVDQIGTTTAGAGLKVFFFGYRT